MDRCINCAGPISTRADIEVVDELESVSIWICNRCWGSLDEDEKESWSEIGQVILP